MNRLLKGVRDNRLTSFMVLFIGLFYAFAMVLGIIEKNSSGALKNEKKETILSTKDIRDKETLFKKNIQGHTGFIVIMTLLFFIVLFCGIFADAYLFGRWLKGAPLVSGGIPHEAVAWGLKEVCQVFVFLIFIETVILVFEYVIGFFFDPQNIEEYFILMLNSFVRDLAAAGFVITLVSRRFRCKLATIGLTAKNLFKNIQIGLFGYLAIIPAIPIVLFVLSYAAHKFSYEPPVQEVVQVYLREKGSGALLFFTFFVAILGPVVEEIFFRGFTYKVFRQKFGVRWALVISSAIFAGLHMSPIAFLPIFLLGFFLATLYERTGSLVPSMTVHMLHNLIMVSMTLVFKRFAG